MANIQINDLVDSTGDFISQDNGDVESRDGGKIIALSGNAWKQASLPVIVTEGAVL